jgi:ribonuclease HI
MQKRGLSGGLMRFLRDCEDVEVASDSKDCKRGWSGKKAHRQYRRNWK